ncbi:nuclear transport factor 2 family protein [Streptomyces litchfieldiae]|uniref:Nuclear transport factor 2 family protein n=1 Tax=Streptomyces litchfieldiae TaxID=3075543 RepID=A0ABU2MPH4_9ACTN|nr:nuclear transport factor 2 family protein [Streptomyces sp. DSM 44938]MDT0343450.1 nuclear transport factor 2 family protein [Streptomyces sp. DSM 44938]
MLDEYKRKEIVAEYFRLINEGGTDRVLAMFTENAAIEDPVGEPVRAGRAAQRDYVRATLESGARVRTLHASAGQDGRQVAVPVVVTTGAAVLDAISVFTIDAAGLIENLRVFSGSARDQD